MGSELFADAGIYDIVRSGISTRGYVLEGSSALAAQFKRFHGEIGKKTGRMVLLINRSRSKISILSII